MAERGSPLAVRFDTEPLRRDRLRHRLGGGPETSREIAFELLSLPLYCVGQTHRLIREAMLPCVGPADSVRTLGCR